MLGKLKNLLGGTRKPAVLSPEDEQRILKKGSTAERLALAGRDDVRPEVLYYLSDDSDADVRRAIASNSATPIQADDKLTGDSDDDIRAELARKIGRLVPGLDDAETGKLRERAIKVLEKLAQDQLPKVRAIIAEEIKSADNVPKAIIQKLASDVEDMVAGPVLEYSPLLNDDDLREIIAAGISSKALTSIARRSTVSEDIAEDIAATLDIPSVAALLTNDNAQIREDTLDQIIDQAQDVEGLHKPLAMRPQLSLRAMKRIAGFVASALVQTMIERATLPEEQAEDILEKVRERINTEEIDEEDDAAMAKTAQDLFDRGVLDDAYVMDQVEQGNREITLHALAVLADAPIKPIRQVIKSKSGRAVTALAWKAGLKMRTAFALQTKLALVPNAQLMPGKDGDTYPISEDELEWHLSYFLDQQ